VCGDKSICFLHVRPAFRGTKMIKAAARTCLCRRVLLPRRSSVVKIDIRVRILRRCASDTANDGPGPVLLSIGPM
jgi:hypothetical protein